MSGKIHVRLNHPHGIHFDGTGVTLKGNAFHLLGQEKGVLPTGLFGHTVVDADKWELVKSTYPDLIRNLERNNTLVYHAEDASSVAAAKERRESRHGREPVDVEKDPTVKTKEVTDEVA
ncbi:hypothetical protein [Dickeya poaceiphila]|uniref:Uncharacterized protein n=1 Tax=Dickeya poaceiphila TaxID=568768 RepID=A0A5B8IAU0_9GAMM|nr:hypothetical protein [Dickeya poaceiphila]QDX29550.1 hypothetical protein Dpoa569_0001329 [Dickeya poaceiphila]